MLRRHTSMYPLHPVTLALATLATALLPTACDGLEFDEPELEAQAFRAGQQSPCLADETQFVDGSEYSSH